MKIKIHNDIWKVEMVDEDAKKMNPDENHYNFGLTEYKELLISIMAGRCASVTRSTVIHRQTDFHNYCLGQRRRNI